MSSEPLNKKQKVTPKLVKLLENFHIEDCDFQPFVSSSKCNLVPLVYSETKGPVLVQLNGGGKIPVSFGIDDKEIDGKRKVQVAFQIDSLLDHENLDRLRTELGESAVKNWSVWFPDNPVPSREILMNFCGNFVSPRKKKKTGDSGMWSGVAKASIDPDECTNNKCKIVDDSGNYVTFSDLPGMTWNKIILEFRWIYIQATKSYGITKRLKYMLCTPIEDEGEIEPL